VCGSKGSSQSSSTFTPPKDVLENYRMLAERAKNVANTPFQQYTGEMVAGLSPTQQAGIANVNAASGMAQPYFQAGTGYIQSGAQGFTPEAANQYMSPYIENVANKTMANLGETNAQQQQQVLGSSIGRGAFGGDRAGIAQAELARQQGLATGQTMANIYQGGYGQAQAQFNADQARKLGAGQTLGGFGTAAQTAALQGAQAQLGAGAQEQAVRQAQDTANQQQFQAAQAYPFQTTQYLANLLLGIGGQSGGTSLTSSPGPNIGTQFLGGLMSLGSIPWGSFSDERLKDNMEPVGKTFDGQNIYKFNYKGDGQTMLGLSAQEVEHHKPEAVRKDDAGLRMVNYDLATQGAADKGHFANGGATDWMGGAVQEGLGRMHFADQGAVPYSEQPSGGTAKPLTLADVMRVVKYDKVGGRTNIPEAPKAFDQGSLLDVAKQLQNATTEQRANMADNISALRSKLGLGTVAPSDVIGTSQGTYSLGLHYSSGGGIDRQGYAGDTGQSGGVAPEQSDSWLPSKGQSAIEKATGLNLSDNARMGLLAAGLGMLSSRSPFFGVGVGEGATAGLGTYYNALANDRAYEKQKRELEMTEEQRQIERDRVAVERQRAGIEGNRVDIEKQRAGYEGMGKGIDAFNLLMGGFAPVATEKGIMYRNPYGTDLLTQDQYAKLRADALKKVPGLGSIIPSGVQGGVAPVTSPDQGGVAPVTRPNQGNTEGNVPVPPTESTVPRPATENAPARTSAQPAEPPATTTGTVGADAFQNVDDAYNPFMLRKLAEQQKQIASNAESYGLKDQQQAADARAKDFLKRAEDVENGNVQVKFKDGTFGYVPEVVANVHQNAAEKKQSEASVEQMNKVDEDLGKSSDSRPAAYARINDAKRILEVWQSGKLSDIKADLPALASALGLDVSKYKLDDVVSQQTFAKDATQAMFDAVKNLGGRILVNEIEGQKKANYEPSLQPGTNRNILGSVTGLMQAEDKFFEDYNVWRNGPGKYATLAQYNAWKTAWRKNPENNVDKFIETARANTPVREKEFPKPSDRKKGWMYIIPQSEFEGDAQMSQQYPKGIKARWKGNGWDLSSMEAVQ